MVTAVAARQSVMRILLLSINNCKSEVNVNHIYSYLIIIYNSINVLYTSLCMSMRLE